LIAGSCLLLLFSAGPGSFAVRSLRYVWNLGHIVAFAAFCMLLLDHWQGLAGKTFFPQMEILLLFGLIAGGLVEVVQAATGGDCSWSDLGRDLIGCLTASAFFSGRRLMLNKAVRWRVQAATIGLVILAAVPLLLSLADEAMARRQFPILGGFECPLEIDRWEGDARLAIDHGIFATGKASLKMELNTTRYSGATLKYFPGDWQGYQALRFAIFNPEAVPLKIMCKVADRAHDRSGHRYKDRFNGSFELNCGWNRILVPMADIEAAPKKRKMDLRQVTQVSLFAAGLKRNRIIYLDDVRLMRETTGSWEDKKNEKPFSR
jgi:hypothetical protein